MKSNWKPSCIFFIFLILLLSCKEKNNETTTIQEPNPQVRLEKGTVVYTISCIKDSTLNFKTELKEKLIALQDLEDNYEIIRIEKKDYNSSIIVNGLNNTSKIVNPSKEYKILNVEDFPNCIKEINHGFIKGNKDMGGRLYAGARAEELILNSEKTAKNLVAFINEMDDWDRFDKSLNFIFNDKNKVYYVSASGWYMMDIFNQIEEKMKEGIE